MRQNMKLYLDFDPCQECTAMMAELSSPEMFLPMREPEQTNLQNFSDT